MLNTQAFICTARIAATKSREPQTLNLFFHTFDTPCCAIYLLHSIPYGIYAREYDVTYISVKVKVKVKSDEIIDISIVEHSNERGKPAERMIHDMIEKQKINVDALSSAANSCMVIKKVVENALQGGSDSD